MATVIHDCFVAHPDNFSPGIERLLAAHAALEPFGMFLLPLAKAETRRDAELRRHTQGSVNRPQLDALPEYFDVALSFAGSERPIAELIAQRVRAGGFTVFYDDFYPAQLWGKNLVDFFDEIYRKRSRHCLMIISQEYADRMWTTHERRSAQARALEEKGSEYILPVRTDSADLPGMQPSTAYLSLEKYDAEGIADLLIKRLRA
ncbi:MAG TPA: TIR domain-containing protein [Armatimonadota bacterium]|nr:TIR domain-containing protein [Armatimonadota bacterium]